jgi:cell wall-associated NlpC family hydrolase
MPLSEQRQAVLRIAPTWIGTPFQYGQCVKGPKGGVDCGRYPAAVLKEAGVIDIDIAKLPQLPPLWFLHNTTGSYLEIIRRYATEYELQPGEQPRPGDLVIVKFGRDWAHSAIVLDWPKIIGAAYDHCVAIWRNIYLSPQFGTRELKFFNPFHD